MTTSVQPAPLAQSEVCPSCGTELKGKFCHHCGEKRRHEEELALKHFALHGLHELTHLDSKVFATVRYSSPGLVISRRSMLPTCFFALRRVYQQSAGLTLIKGLFTLVVTWLALIATQVVAMVIGIISAAKS